LLLTGGEFAVDGEGAGEVGVVIGVAGGDVEEEEVAVGARLVIRDVVEDAGVFAAGDDGVVGEIAAAPDEFMGEFGLDFGFVDAGLYEAGDALEAGVGDVAGGAEEADFLVGLHGTEGVQEAGEALVIVEGIAALGVRDEPVVAGFDLDDGALVLVGVEVDVLAFAHEAAEDAGEFGQPFDARDAGAFAGLLFGEFVAFPDGDEFAGFAQEQDFSEFLVVGIGIDEQDAFFLVDAGEVKEVGVLAQAEGAVGVGGGDVIGIDDDEGVGQQEFGQPRAVVNEQGRVDGSVTHKFNCRAAG